MIVDDVINRRFVTITADTTMQAAAAVLSDNAISDVVVVDDDGDLAGVLSEGDLLRAMTPGVDDLALVADGSLAEAFDLLVANGRHLADQPVARLVIRDPIVVAPDDPLLRAVTVMITMNIHGLPVVRDGRVVGRITRADVCRGLLGQLPGDARQPAAAR